MSDYVLTVSHPYTHTHTHTHRKSWLPFLASADCGHGGVRGWGSGWEVGVRRGVASTGLFPDGKEGAIVRPGSFLQICSIYAEQEERDL